MDDPRLQFVRNLIYRYQETSDPEVFKQILKRVDDLVLSTVFKLRRRWKYLKTLKTGDLYQTGIVGLYDAINTFRTDETENDVPARIIAYIGLAE